MSVLVGASTRILVQGIASREGAIYASRMMAYGTHIVAGVSFGRGGTWFASVPVFDTVQEAVRATDADTALVCVPASEAAEAILEAADAGLALVICITASVPVHDLMLVRAYLRGRDTRLIGPGSPGVFAPGQCVAGIIPPHIVRPGSVGVVSRSGSLAYEVTWLLTQAGFGQSTILGIGGGTIVGTGFVDVLSMFEGDPMTQQVVLVGEIGGQQEEEAAAYVADRMTKPVVAFVTGQTAPAGRQMGHSGAIIEEFAGTAQHKIEALQVAGVRIARSPDEIPSLLERV
jgi:succinyl-CoA synthetase alpha subunit